MLKFLVICASFTEIGMLSPMGSMVWFDTLRTVLLPKSSYPMSFSLQVLHWHFPGIFPHDPVSFMALVRPDLFTYKHGVVRVETQGICTGHTMMDQGLKKYVYTS